MKSKKKLVKETSPVIPDPVNASGKLDFRALAPSGGQALGLKSGKTGGVREPVDVVYAADHAYLFLCCVSVCSLMEHLPSTQQVRLHLLIDETLRREDERLLTHLSDRFSNLRITLHKTDEEAFQKLDFRGSIWSRAACYRLILPKLLPDVDLCLYIDSDTLIVDDITPVWDTDMEGYLLAGVFDDISPVRAQTVGDHIQGIHTYVNSGVLLMNLALMRERKIQEKLLGELGNYLVVDQDLLNVVCYGAIRLLPSDYNCIPGVHCDSPKIIHFLMRDYLRPWKNRRAAWSGQWWRAAESFGGLYDLDELRAQASWYERGSICSMFRRCADYSRVYVVGSGRDAERIHHALRLGKCKGLNRILTEEECLDYDPDALLICASGKRDVPVLRPFLEQGGERKQVLRYARWPISFYNLCPETARREVCGEMLMWEYGVDHQGISTLPALLEVNAARYPDREALAEWKDGLRRACTFLELNRMANRMADWLGRQKLKRGTRIGLSGEAAGSIEFIAAVLGIWKSGCMVDLDQKTEAAADCLVLADEQLCTGAPRADVMPYEPAVCMEGRVLTEKELCLRAEEVRRRTGWHEKDRLLICLPVPPRTGQAMQAESSAGIDAILGVAAAFACGNLTVITSEREPKQLIEIARKEEATIISMDASALAMVSDELSIRAETKEGTDLPFLRMVLTETGQAGTGQVGTGQVGTGQVGTGQVGTGQAGTGQTGTGQAGIGQAGMRTEVPADLAEAQQKWKQVMGHVPVNGQGYDGTFRYDCEWY